MPDSIGPAGNATQVITVPPAQATPEPAQTTENAETPATEADNEVAQTEQVNSNSNVGSNIDTRA